MILPLNPFHSIAAERLLEHAREDGEWITWKLSQRPEPYHGSPEAHLRATLARMKPERRMETLRRLLDEEIAAAQARAHDGVV